MSVVGTTHIDKFLTNLSIKKTSAETMTLIAGKVCPRIPVMKSSDKYPIYGEEYKKKHDLRKTDRTPSRMLTRSMSEDNYICQDYGAKVRVTKKDMKNFDTPLDAKIDGTEFVTETMQMNEEQRVAAKFGDSDNYAGSNVVTLSGTDQWDDYNNSTPIADVVAAKIQVKKSGVAANTVIIPYDTAVVLANHPNYLAKVSDRLNTIEGLKGNAWTSGSGLLPKLEGLNVIVPSGVVDEAADGDAVSNADVWDGVWVGYINPKAQMGLKDKSFAACFAHNVDDDGNKGVRRVYKQAINKVDIHGVDINVEESTDEKIIAADLGYLIKDVIS